MPSGRRSVTAACVTLLASAIHAALVPASAQQKRYQCDPEALVVVRLSLAAAIAGLPKPVAV